MANHNYRMYERQIIALTLFIICTIHTMIYNFFQIPYSFLTKDIEATNFVLNSILYSVALITALLYPIFIRFFTLKYTFIGSLVFNMLALICIWISEAYGEVFSLLALSVFFMGISCISVINCLVSYITIEFPKSLTVAVVALFIFANLGILIQSVLYDYFQGKNFSIIFCAISIILLFASIWFVQAKFFNFSFPKRLAHLRQGSILWKELHYRLALFVFVMLCYGAAETIFAIWSFDYLAQFLNLADVNFATTLFWCFMVVGLITLLPPIYFYSARKIFTFLVLFMIGVTYFIIWQTHPIPLLAGYIAAGFGCSVIVAILIAFFEEETIASCRLSQIPSHLPFTEIGISLMMGGYFTGVGIATLLIIKFESLPIGLNGDIFYWAICLFILIGLISTYLNWGASRPSRQKSH